MTRCGASASWRKKIFSAGDVADPGGVGAAREDVERVQAGAERRVVARLHDPPGVVVVAHVAAPRQRLVGDPDARARRRARPARAAARRRARRRRSPLPRRWSRRARVGAELLHHRELALRAPQVRRAAAPPAPPRSRAAAGRARSRARAPRSGAGPPPARAARAIRSGSNSSTASKPAAAAAASFSSSVPLRQTVAIERRSEQVPELVDAHDRRAHAEQHDRDADDPSR